MPKEPFQAAHKGQPCQGARIPLGKKERYLGTRDRTWRKHWKTSLEIIINAAIMPQYIPWYFSRPTTMQGGALFHENNVTKLKYPSYPPTRTLLCVPPLGVIYVLLCGVVLPNGIDSGSKKAWGKYKYHTSLWQYHDFNKLLITNIRNVLWLHYTRGLLSDVSCSHVLSVLD